MKKYFTLLLTLLVTMTVQAELLNGHFFKQVQNENLTEEEAVECLDQWFSLPQETEWRKVSERTDKLGMTRIEYRQYVSGVEVEHSQVLLHMKDGHVQTANGTVMETKQTPAKVRRHTIVYKNGTPTDLLGRKLYLIDTPDGYRYATKVLSANKKEWIYTDVETDVVLKRIPTRHKISDVPVQVTGKSIYSGNVTMDATYDSESGTYFLYDSQRKIFTLIGATIPSREYMIENHVLKKNFPELEQYAPGDEAELNLDDAGWNKIFEDNNIDLEYSDMATLINNNAIFACCSTPMFDSYSFKSITFSKLTEKDDNNNLVNIVPSVDNPVTLMTQIRYTGTDGLIEMVKEDVTALPYKIDMNGFYDELPLEGADIVVSKLVLNDKEEFDKYGKQIKYKKLPLTKLTLVPDATLSKSWTQNDVVATADYESGKPWSAVDIHWGMEQTIDFYRTAFDRDSYDNNGAQVINLFYLPDNEICDAYYEIDSYIDNAAAIPITPPVMVYGMGSYLGLMYPLVELSVMAHEFTHLVTENTAQLEYLGESGALNESFSDLMGISVKKYVQGNDATWTIGEGMFRDCSNLRSMSSPKESMDGNGSCPDTYMGENWVDTNSEFDSGGVHINSGVQNKWYYLLTDGGEGTNDNNYSYQVTGIGIEKSQQIAYRTLVEYATQQSQYADIRLASLQSAKDLYGENSEEVKAVADAWKAVGVGEKGDGIEEVENERVKSEEYSNEIYDLSGRKVNSQLSPVNSHLKKGIYIQNGKKVLR